MLQTKLETNSKELEENRLESDKIAKESGKSDEKDKKENKVINFF